MLNARMSSMSQVYKVPRRLMISGCQLKSSLCQPLIRAVQSRPNPHPSAAPWYVGSERTRERHATRDTRDRERRERRGPRYVQHEAPEPAAARVVWRNTTSDSSRDLALPPVPPRGMTPRAQLRLLASISLLVSTAIMFVSAL